MPTYPTSGQNSCPTPDFHHSPTLDRELLTRGIATFHNLEKFLLKFGLLENYASMLSEEEQNECCGMSGIAATLGALYAELSEIRNRMEPFNGEYHEQR